MSRGVLMISRLAPPDHTGAGKQAVALANELIHLNCDVRLLTSEARLRWPRQERLGALVAVRWPRMWAAGRGQKAAFAGAVALHMIAHPRRYSIVHVHGAFFLLRMLRLLRPLLRFRLVYKTTMMGMDDPRRIAQLRGDRLLRSVDRWACVTEEIADAALEVGVPPSRVITIPNGVDGRRFRPRSESERAELRRKLNLPFRKPVWVTVGAVIPRKRLHLLVRAWACLPAPRPLLLIVGPNSPGPVGADAACLRSLEAEIHDAGLHEDVRLLGERDDVPDILGASDGFVFASAQEGLPNAVLEALACGLPVVSASDEAGEDLKRIGDRAVCIVLPAPQAIAEGVSATRVGERVVPKGLAAADLREVARRYAAMYDELTVKLSARLGEETASA